MSAASVPARGWDTPLRRGLMLFGAMFLLVVAVGISQGAASLTLILIQATAYALIALGLNIQWGYGGLFNFAIMGFMMVGGASTVFLSYPINVGFWQSDGPIMLGRVLLAFLAGLALVLAARQSHRIGLSGRLKTALVVLAWFVGYIVYRSQIDPAVAYIESTVGFVGGLGLNPVLAWAFGGLVAAVIAFFIGRISLGLRTDYLAIATIGMSEILRALIKNMDWLTNGTKTVTPLPWATPLPQQLQAAGMSISESFVYARMGFLAIALVILVLAFILVERAYGGPWGRMMRAIRDNHIAAGSMGKDVTGRQLELFIFGSVLMGIGGAMVASFTQIFDPSGYQPINHTFMVWVMVIVGGAGNSWGVVLGAFLIYIVWIISDPIAQLLFLNISALGEGLGWGAIPDIASRALQARVFVLGVVITVALRYAPRGLIPEVVRKG